MKTLKIRTIVYLNLFMLLLGNAIAGEKKIFTIYSDIQAGSINMKLDLGAQDKISKFIFEGIDGQGRYVDSKSYTVADLNNGATLIEGGGYKVVNVKSGDFDAVKGGFVKIDYLVNGIRGSRGTLELKFEADANGWYALHNGSRVESLTFKKNSYFGQTVGISKIEVGTKSAKCADLEACDAPLEYEVIDVLAL